MTTKPMETLDDIAVGITYNKEAYTANPRFSVITPDMPSQLKFLTVDNYTHRYINKQKRLSKQSQDSSADPVSPLPVAEEAIPEAPTPTPKAGETTEEGKVTPIAVQPSKSATAIKNEPLKDSIEESAKDSPKKGQTVGSAQKYGKFYGMQHASGGKGSPCLLYTSPSPRD
eukprot:TRINITY_DN3906_c0_g3_i1.p1 TRINITY_DN3906_c0_g3~~TRINITY_DN3906_c0_g3_i1.p1  ORF type:complete len:171 (-),score=41.65 TRINITY_DN3906_c0_g3_i1:53-565(-)